MSILTKGEVHRMSQRVDEIDSILDLCDSNRDSDVIENLENELDLIMEKLKVSIRALEKNETA